MIKHLLLIVLSLTVFSEVQAQQEVLTSSGEVSGSTGTSTFSIGQFIMFSGSNSGGTIIPGALQTYEIFNLHVDESQFKYAFMVYPNPTVDFVFIEIGDYPNQSFSAVLSNSEGKIIGKYNLQLKENKIDTSHLGSGVYYLRILENENKPIADYKLIISK